MAASLKCRGCFAPLDRVVIDLGPAPLANSFVSDIDAVEAFYPLRLFVCESCWLVQLPATEAREAIFNDQYAYFSSSNASFVEHARRFAERVTATLAPNVVYEVASNDGYLLQHFRRPTRVLGIEPSANVAEVAIERGITTRVAFFGAEIAQECAATYGKADLIIANNVLAHVPDLHDFVEGFRRALAPGGRVSIEFPHLLNLIEQTQFDTIYHEHYSYFSLMALAPVFGAHDLSIVDVEMLPTHGGSLRVWLCHRDEFAGAAEIVTKLAIVEYDAQLDEPGTYDAFARASESCKNAALEWLITQHKRGRSVGGYGAPAKGNTFLNWAGVKRDLLPWTVDGTEFKQGKYLPGTRIPIYAETYVGSAQPDFLLVLPWNWSAAIAARARDDFGFRGQIMRAIPRIEVV